MNKRAYLIIRDLHLYFGLFVSPFVLLFAASVLFLVHVWLPGGPSGSTPTRRRIAEGLQIDPAIVAASGPKRVDAARSVLNQIGVRGEIGFVRHVLKEQKLIVPVSVPGRETTVEIDLARGSAVISERETGLADAAIMLHKLPGPHLADIRMNWGPMVAWRSFADGTAYLVLFISASGIYLWWALRSERRIGLALLGLGAVSFLGIAYAIAG